MRHEVSRTDSQGLPKMRNSLVEPAFFQKSTRIIYMHYVIVLCYCKGMSKESKPITPEFYLHPSAYQQSGKQ